jgi:predicted HD phosphohydrolase
MNLVLEPGIRSLFNRTGDSLRAYLRVTRYDEHGLELAEIARRAGIAQEFLAGAIWGATELSNSDVAHLVVSQSADTTHRLDTTHPDAIWPSFVAKEGSD